MMFFPRKIDAVLRAPSLYGCRAQRRQPTGQGLHQAVLRHFVCGCVNASFIAASACTISVASAWVPIWPMRKTVSAIGPKLPATIRPFWRNAARHAGHVQPCGTRAAVTVGAHMASGAGHWGRPSAVRPSRHIRATASWRAHTASSPSASSPCAAAYSAATPCQ